MSTIKLSMTNNPGSVFYGGSGYTQMVSNTDTSIDEHKIRIVISNEELEKATVHLSSETKIVKEIEVPTYKLLLTDSKTGKEKAYRVTRDVFLHDMEKAPSKKGGMSFFGVSLFQKKVYSFPAVSFEPRKYSIEKYDVSNLRKLTNHYVSYKMENVNQKAYLVAGDVPADLIQQQAEKESIKNLFYVIEGKAFLNDIKEREDELKLNPIVEILIMKRDTLPHNVEMTKDGRTGRTIYLT